jgi:hypothetical protein
MLKIINHWIWYKQVILKLEENCENQGDQPLEQFAIIYKKIIHIACDYFS